MCCLAAGVHPHGMGQHSGTALRCIAVYLMWQVREGEAKIISLESSLSAAQAATSAGEQKARAELAQSEKLLTMAQNDVAELRLARNELQVCFVSPPTHPPQWAGL